MRKLSRGILIASSTTGAGLNLDDEHDTAVMNDAAIKGGCNTNLSDESERTAPAITRIYQPQSSRNRGTVSDRRAGSTVRIWRGTKHHRKEAPAES